MYLSMPRLPPSGNLSNELLTQSLVPRAAHMSELVVASDLRVLRHVPTPRHWPSFIGLITVVAHKCLALAVAFAHTKGGGPVPAPLVFHW